MSLATLNTFSIYWILLALILVPIQLKIVAPYGRHVSNKWGLMIDNKVGWVLMEIISPFVLLVFIFYDNLPNCPTLLIAGLWLIYLLFSKKIA